ncbi:thiamine-phosphate pyrophosphorylase [Granulicella aggregans]|uniref:Thiamine-phosphate synthase n=1 Tax=Granulicella aggregans TaxID=474949 RepID=A0A7W7ZDC4_9BACT|nr:thiamine-phosphate pyrophosphorylase [Granulicella aggregans]
MKALPRLYVIADAGMLLSREVSLANFANELRAAGVTLLQYRDKDAGPQTILRNAVVIAEAFAGSDATLIMNDRSDLAVLAEWDGVHVGQEDLSPEDARTVIGSGRIVGISTHNEAQVIAADAGAADYVAIGPVFATGTKLDAAVVVGLDGVRRARAMTTKPLVAIGGITRENARSVIEAGADSVAVISGLFVPGESVEKVARDFLEILG